jgi:TRAP transporter TAXI family solute receptor
VKNRAISLKIKLIRNSFFMTAISLFIIFSALAAFLDKPVFSGPEEKIVFKKIVEFLPMGTGSKTGTYYPLGMAFANIISKKNEDLNVMAMSTKGSVQNLELLKQGDIKLCICQSDVAYEAFNGKGSYKQTPYKDMRVVMSLFPEVVQIAVRKESGILDISDLKGKKVIMGAQKSGNAKTAELLLSAFNISLSDVTPLFINYDEAIKTMSKDRADAFILVAGLPTRVISELFSKDIIRLLEFKDDQLKELLDKKDFFSKKEIQENTYTGQEKKVVTAAINALLISDSSMDNQTALKIVNTLLDNHEYLKKCHPRAADISYETMFDAVPQGSMHSGVTNYQK